MDPEDVEDVIKLLEFMLEDRDPYSETWSIKPDGFFDSERPDGSVMYLPMYDGRTPSDMYRLAAEVQKIKPDWHFSFESDPEGKWMKYTVTRK